LLAVLAILQHRGASLNVRVVVMPYGKRYGSVDAFMNDSQLDDASIDQALRDAASFGGQVGSCANYQPMAENGDAVRVLERVASQRGKPQTIRVVQRQALRRVLEPALGPVAR